ncbi:MAG: GAF domain-containing protein, partial [Acidobacteriota bacterium]|nr:GAF domain-containing protein [Acidobacteriota bacterium]
WDLAVRSVLCAPLAVGDRPIGALYLATRDLRARFDESHLHLVTAAAGIVALALGNARKLAWLESETRRLEEDLDLEHQMIGESEAARAVYAIGTRRRWSSRLLKPGAAIT